MKAQELRIGNYVFSKETQKHQMIVGVTLENPFIDAITFDYTTYNEIEPIPLTKQWLIDFGFEKKGMFHKGNLSIVQKGELGYSNGRTYFNSWTILEHQPESVHRLQNLYFALTGQDLHL